MILSVDRGREVGGWWLGGAFVSRNYNSILSAARERGRGRGPLCLGTISKMRKPGRGGSWKNRGGGHLSLGIMIKSVEPERRW